MVSSKINHSLLIAGIGICLSTKVALSQSCAEPAATSFRVVTLIDPATGGTSGPLYETGKAGAVGMSIAPDGKIFVAKMRAGQVMVYDPSTPNTMTLAGTISTYFNGEDGLLGIVVDPNYSSNHWIYALYSDPCGANCQNRAVELGRFTFDAALPAGSRLTNKKVILRVPRSTDTHHAAGNMSFDGNGVLVIGTGDNTDPANGNNNGYGPIYYPTVNADAQRTSSNTNDLRGKLLRIKPIAFPDNQTPASGIDSTYSIPGGNLWEKINNPSFNPGWNSTDSMSKVRKEIFTFGHRNPYHPRVDTRSGWIFWGEVGPDASTDNATRGPSGHDEYNLATGAGFYGHPYCNGYNVPYGSLTAPSTTYGSKYDCLETGNPSLTPLVNLSPNNTGIHHMPPAIPALAAYTGGNSTDDDPRFNTTYSLTTVVHNRETAIGGPMYRYNPNLNSAIKFPPYYEGKIFFYDWDERRTFRVISLDSNGKLPAGAAGVTNFAPAGFTTASYLDMQFGPDGALYALRNCANAYSTGNSDGGLYRIEYTGTADNACYKPFNVTILGPGATQTTALQPRVIRQAIPPVMANGLLVLPAGYRTVELYNASGRRIWSFHRNIAGGPTRIQLPASLGQGIWQAKLIP